MDIVVEEIPDNSPTDPQSPVAAARSDAISHLALAPRFDLSSPTKEDENKLAEIWAYAKGVAGSSEIPDVIWEVIHLEGVLGAPRLGESRLDRLYRYAKIKRQITQKQEELRNVTSTGRL